ncbi:hypothetical protein E2C01_048480 [Portunus trituberculatus]|uniref:Uncharacterized protein n=1 Tax=Portunus trituberculatus TaxID=210409 RepID=A0A5B7GAB9_PORTR|nr:hypothetical protein [Portunus trituberculatus]
MNVRLHARQYHLCYVLTTQRWASGMETVIISRKVSIIPPKVLAPPSPTGRGEMLSASALGNPEERLEK